MTTPVLDIDGAERLIDRHLGASPRAVHSRRVALRMARLARHFGADPTLWELVGLCHDLDYFVTQQGRSRHGIVTSEWLAGQLPAETLLAIRTHDHRTGVVSNDLLADILKLADVADLVCEELDRMGVRIDGPDDLEAALDTLLTDRPYIPVLLRSIAERRGIGVELLAELCRPAVER